MNRPDRVLPAATELRLLGFGTAVAGAVAGALAGLGGHRGLAVAVGLRVTGVGLLTMGVATARAPERLAGPAGRELELLRGVVLAAAGTVLAAVPRTAVALLAG